MVEDWGARFGSYLHLSEYEDPDFVTGTAGSRADDVVRTIVDRNDRQSLVARLAVLSHESGRREQLDVAVGAYVASLPDATRWRFEAALSDESLGPNRVVLARHPLLAAIRRVLRDGRSRGDRAGLNHPQVMQDAIRIVHAIGETLDASVDDDGTRLGPWPTYLVMEMARLGPLYLEDDLYALIDRTLRLWRTYGSRLVRSRPRKPPLALLEEAVGLDPLDLFALGLAVMAHAMEWAPSKPLYLLDHMGSSIEPATIEVFLQFIAAGAEDLAGQFVHSNPRFDFLPLQIHPVLRTESGLLALDENYSWDRLTSGLFWVVHDQEKGLGELEAEQWRQTYAEMVELLAEESIRALAPSALGGAVTFYGEEQIGAAYGGVRCDAAIDFGSHVMLFEIVSGQLSTPTRIDGDAAKFIDDTNRLVINKCRQLDTSAAYILSDPARLTGFTPHAGLRVQPVLVVAGGYPVNPMTIDYVTSVLDQKGLLKDPRLEGLGVIELPDLEGLEGLVERGDNPLDVLGDWYRQERGRFPLRHFIAKRVGGFGFSSRPARMQAHVSDAMKNVLLPRLGLPPT
jgi:hypothetical protein